jgi:hypothetical protein
MIAQIRNIFIGIQTESHTFCCLLQEKNNLFLKLGSSLIISIFKSLQSAGKQLGIEGGLP